MSKESNPDKPQTPTEKKGEKVDDAVLPDLLSYYSRQTSMHVSPMITAFFGLLGIIYILNGTATLSGKVIFSIGFWIVAGISTYFYGRLLYFGFLCEEILSYPRFAETHSTLARSVIKQSIFARLALQFSEPGGRYSPSRAWILFLLAAVAGIGLWIEALLHL